MSDIIDTLRIVITAIVGIGGLVGGGLLVASGHDSGFLLLAGLGGFAVREFIAFVQARASR